MVRAALAVSWDATLVDRETGVLTTPGGRMDKDLVDQVIDAAARVVASGAISANGHGNISIRVPGAEEMYFTAGPSLGLVQESCSHAGFIHSLEKPEEGRAFPMNSIMVIVKNGSDTTNPFPLAPSQEELGRRMQEERILLPVQQILHIKQQRRNPLGIIAIDFPWEMNKLPHFTGFGHRDYFNLIQDSAPLIK